MTTVFRATRILTPSEQSHIDTSFIPHFEDRFRRHKNSAAVIRRLERVGDDVFADIDFHPSRCRNLEGSFLGGLNRSLGERGLFR